MSGLQCTSDVAAVLLVDGWHDVDGEFRFTGPGSAEPLRLLFGTHAFEFRKPNGATIYGPMSSVLALRLAKP